MALSVAVSVDSGAVPPCGTPCPIVDVTDAARETDFGPSKRWSTTTGVVVQHLDAAGRVVASTTTGHGLAIRARTVTAGGMVLELGAVNTHECVIDILHDHDALGDLATDAGERLAAIRRACALRLRDLYEQAGIATRVVATYSRSTGGRSCAIDPEAADAETAYRSVLRLPELRPYMTVLSTVCCHGHPPRPQHVQTLRQGLDLLARHWGYVSARRPRITGGPLTAA